MRISFAFHGHQIAATLEANPAARELLTMLPLDLAIEDYSTNEKIAYLPQKLTDRSAEPFAAEAPGDLCYYAPWGNLVLYYDRYRYAPGLIRLGRLHDWAAPLKTRGRHALRVEILAQAPF